MEKEVLKQKRKLGFSIGLYLLIANVAMLLISIPIEKLGIVNSNNETLITYIANAICLYAIGYMFLKLFLKKVEVAQVEERQKMGFGQFMYLFMISVGGGLFVNLLTQIVVSLIKLIFRIEIGNRVADIVGVSNPILLIIFVSLLGPIFEELIFRGVLLERLRVFGDKTAIIYTAIGFGLFHSNFSQIPFAIALGLIFGYAVVKTNNIKYSILLHILMNSTSVLLVILMNYGLEGAEILIVVLEMLSALATIISLPILLSSNKYKLKFKNEGKYDKKKLYNNIGYIFSVIVVILITGISMIND